MPKPKPLTSREVMGVLKSALYSPGNELVKEYITRLHAALDETDQEDMLGTEGWRRYLLGEDE